MHDLKSEIIVFDERLIGERDYWLGKLSPETQPSGVRPDRAWPAEAAESDYRSVELTLEDDLRLRLSKLTGDGPFLLYTVLMSALKVCLRKHTGRDVVVVGSPALRSAGGAPSANALAISDVIDERLSFRQLLVQVRQTLLDAYAHQLYPAHLLARDLGLSSHGPKSPLFDIVLLLDEIHDELPAPTADLTLRVSRAPGRLGVRALYDARLYEEETVRRLFAHLCNALRAGVADTGVLLRDIEIVGGEELRQLLGEWNATDADYERACAHELFERQCDRAPDAPALSSGDQSLTYRELDDRANQLARRLRRRGVGPEVLVGVMMERSIEMVVALLAVLKAGGAYVPIDPDYPAERVNFMLADADLRVLLTQDALAGRLRGQLGTRGVELISTDGQREELARESASRIGGGVGPQNLAYVIYTSGSTGRPKGVEITHGSLSNLVNWHRLAYGVGPADRATQLAAPAFDASVWEVWPYLCAGASLHVPDRETRDFAPKLVQWLARERISICFLPTPLAEAALREPWPPDAAPRLLLTGGDKLRRRPSEATPFTLVNHYGPTENTVVTTAATVTTCAAGDPPIGKPIANVQVYVLDERLRPVPVGVTGELYVGGDGLARGYLNRPELTAERFVPHPLAREGGARLYRTGDLVRRLPSGDLEFVGRNDRQLKLRGFRIEPREIEAALEQHAAVRETVVGLREDGAAGARLVAYVVAENGALDPGELRGFLKERLPEYMLPSAFVRLDALPLTPHGKVDHEALPEPAPLGPDAGGRFVAPRTPIEEVLAGVYAEVLGAGRVSVDDNFFALGGNSLHATQAISRVNNLLQTEVPLQSIFESPTVGGLAAHIEERMRAGAGLSLPPIERAPRDGNGVPLSFAQRRLWFLNQLEPDSPAYNVPCAVRMKGRLDLSALRRSLDEIVRRHEPLRTVFAAEDGEPSGVVVPAQPVPLSREDLSALPEAEREPRARQLMAEEARLTFDLARGPLLRVRLLRLGEDEHLLLVTMHHIVSDGWSLGVFVGEMTALYEALAASAPPALPELPVQYSDFAAWQRRWLHGDVLDAQLFYWRRQLAGAPPLLELPADRPRPPARTYRGGMCSAVLPDDLYRSLRALSQHEQATLFMTLLAVFKAQLRGYTGRDDVLVGTDIANRNRLETEGLIGFFVNHLVLRTDLSGDPTFRQLLARVRKVTLDAYTHQDLPFDQLVKALNPKRAESYPPIFQVLFVLQNAPVPPLELPSLTLTPVEFDPGSSKFDLAVMLKESPRGVVQTWTYNADIFERSRVEGMLADFAKLLGAVAADPDLRLRDLDALVRPAGAAETAAETAPPRAGGQIKRSARRAVKLSQASPVRMGRDGAGEDGGARELPLVVAPVVEDVDLVAWGEANRALLEERLLRHGALLFRGFGVASVPGFEQFAQAVCPHLFSEYGDLPREGVSGKIYRSTPYPADKAILFHNESSHLRRWPLKIWFFCVTPSREGGETPLVDCREVYRGLDPRIRERFEQKGVMYVRNFTDGLDVSWRQFFGTDERAEVERRCREAGMEFAWNGDGLRTRQVLPAVREHPKTGEKLFFNQILLHHLSRLDAGVRASLLSMYGEGDAPRHVYYGDGSPIEDSTIESIQELYRRLAVSFPWRQGDILMLDNMLTAHARNPFAGERKIVVAMGELTE